MKFNLIYKRQNSSSLRKLCLLFSFLVVFSLVFNFNLHAQTTKAWDVGYEIIYTGNVIELSGGGYTSLCTVKIPDNTSSGFHYHIMLVKFDASYNFIWAELLYINEGIQSLQGLHLSENALGQFLIAGKYDVTPYSPVLLKVNSSSTGTVIWDMFFNEIDAVKTINSPEVDFSTGSSYNDIYLLHGGHSSALQHMPILSRIDNNAFVKSSIVFVNDKQTEPIDFAFKYAGASDNLSAFYVLGKQHETGLAGPPFKPLVYRFYMGNLPQSTTLPGSPVPGPFSLDPSKDEWGERLNLQEYEDIEPVAILHRATENENGNVWVLANIRQDIDQVYRPAVFRLDASNGAVINVNYYDVSSVASTDNLKATAFTFVPTTDDIAITLTTDKSPDLLLAVIDDDLTALSANYHNATNGIYNHASEDKTNGNILSNGYYLQNYILSVANSNGEVKCIDPLLITAHDLQASITEKTDVELKVEPFYNKPIVGVEKSWTLEVDCSTLKNNPLSIVEGEQGLDAKVYVNNKTIYVNSNEMNNKIQLLSSDGKIIGNFTYNSGKYIYNGQNLPKGVYLLMINDNVSLKTKKIILSE